MNSPRIHAIASGKGGVGKSVLSVGLAQALADQGRRVVLVDGDLAQGALFSYLGLSAPPAGLREFLNSRKQSLRAWCQPILAAGFDFVSAGQETLGLDRLRRSRVQRIQRSLRALDVDDVVIDLGSGTAGHTMDLFLDADSRILVLSPDPASALASLAFAKTALFRAYARRLGSEGDLGQVARSAEQRIVLPQAPAPALLDALAGDQVHKLRVVREHFHVDLVVNQASAAVAQGIHRALDGVCRRGLGFALPLAGHVIADPAVVLALRRRQIWCAQAPRTFACVELIAQQLKRDAAPTPLVATSAFSVGFNEEVFHKGRSLHVQTEDLGADPAALLTLVYSGGQILFKTQNPLPPGGEHGEARNAAVLHQHQTVIRGIEQGRLDHRLGQLAGAA